MLDKLAQRYSCRPSEVLEIEDRYSAYCLDEAVITFCAGVEKQVEDVPTPKGKKGAERRQKNQDLLIKQLLQIKDDPKVQKFRDPAEMLKGR